MSNRNFAAHFHVTLGRVVVLITAPAAVVVLDPHVTTEKLESGTVIKVVLLNTERTKFL